MVKHQIYESYCLKSALARDLDLNKEVLTEEKEIIRNKLISDLSPETFGTSLKKYMYGHMGISMMYPYLSEQVFLTVLKKSVEETRTGNFIAETDQLDAVLMRYLRADVVTREELFVLGFALNMTVADVSFFLTDVLKENDFDFLDPYEVVIWYCLYFEKTVQASKRLMERYWYSQKERLDDIGTWEVIICKPEFDKNKEYYLKAYLSNLKYRFRYDCVVSERRECFKKYYEKLCNMTGKTTPEELAELLYDSEKRTEPVFWHGNLTRYKLTGSRLRKILEGECKVDRFDLITVIFAIYALDCRAGDDGNTVQYFLNEVKNAFRYLQMRPIHTQNTYENLLLQSLLNRDQIGTFRGIF